MNLILLFPEDFEADDRVVLTGRRARYVREVHRARPGDRLCVGRVDDRIGTGVVRSLCVDHVELDVELEHPPPPPLPATLVLALPRPLVLKRVLIAVTSLGIKRVVLINPRRVDKSFWSSTALRPEAIREQLVLGLEQARDTRLPEVWQRPRFRPFVEDELPALAADGLGLIAHPGAGLPCPRQVSDPVTLAVGPEGGFSDYEVEAFEAVGFERIGLGERILRVETAVPALLARLF